MNLLSLRNRLSLATRGVDLLQKKRDALVKEFFDLVHDTLDARRQLNETAREAYTALLLAKAFDGPQEVEALAFGVPAVSEARAETLNIWGARAPKLAVDWPKGAVASPVGLGGRTVAAQAAFRRFSKALVQVANTETRLRRMGEEIKKTARRVNALEQAVIPGVRSQIRYIRQVLDQQEQEEVFRLKRIKGKITTRSRE